MSKKLKCERCEIDTGTLYKFSAIHIDYTEQYIYCLECLKKDAALSEFFKNFLRMIEQSDHLKPTTEDKSNG